MEGFNRVPLELWPRYVAPGTTLKRVSWVEETGTRKTTGVGEDRDGEGRRPVGPGEVVMEGEVVGWLVPGGGRALEFPGVG